MRDGRHGAGVPSQLAIGGQAAWGLPAIGGLIDVLLAVASLRLPVRISAWG